MSIKLNKLSILYSAIIFMLADIAIASNMNLAQTPLFLQSPLYPNILIALDNSQSMDGTMPGKLVAGNDVTTRGNIGRSVMRNTITNYRSIFNWGLMSFQLSGGTTKYNTYPYFFGSDITMVFTDDCVNGISATNGNLRCIANPEPFAGGNFITYEMTGDDPSVNDVLYTGWTGNQYWGLASGGATTYCVRGNHNPVNSWTSASMAGANQGCIAFTPTDAGFLPTHPPYTRQIWLKRAWGYYANVTGKGILNEPITSDTTAHYSSLQNLMANETGNATTEIKNAAVFTPLPGVFNTAKKYFAGTYTGNASPITNSCQRNYMMLITDGMPTAKDSGTVNDMYPLTEQANTYNAGTNSWTFGIAATDTINAVNSLRSTAYGGNTYDIKTYVVALGDSVANASAVALMNKMAETGGTSNAYFANDSTTFNAAIQSITEKIANAEGSAAAVTMNSSSWSTGEAIYQVLFTSGTWAGQILSLPIDDDNVIGTSTWDAAQKITAQNYDTARTILTIKPSATKGQQGIAFRWPANSASPSATELDSSQITALNTNASNTNDGFGSLRLNWLRGSSSNETTGSTPLFRARPVSKLGDIINSAPVYVGEPAFGYQNPPFNDASYLTFYNNNKNRTKMIYVGANDGMLHGIKTADGVEKLAYVPGKVYPNLSQLTSTTYGHRYFVDGTPTVGDIKFTDNTWHTILIGGLRSGGQGIFALDVTNPTNFSENSSNAQATVLWEFNDNNDTGDTDTTADSTMQYALGYSYSQPSIVKMNNGKWAIIMGNGYNSTEADSYTNTSGYGVLYIIDAQTGAVIRKLNTKSGGTTGSPGASNGPNGLTSPSVIDANSDGIADIIYAGDLQGNMWKFNVSSSNPNDWDVAYKTGTTPKPLFTATGKPITTRAQVGKHKTSGYMVYFGTGKYLETSDNTSTSAQSFYGIWDNGVTVNATDLWSQTVLGTVDNTVGTITSTYRITSNNAPASPSASDWTTKRGWKIDLPDTGERQVTDSVLSNGKIIFTSLIPNTDPCAYGGSGWLMELDAFTGNALSYNVLDVNNDGTITVADYVTYNSANKIPSGKKINAIPSSPTIIKNKRSKELETKVISKSDGSISTILEKSGSTSSGRVSWIQLQ